MKCPTHGQDAIAICAHCGRAVCPACAPVAASRRTACSEACAQGLAKADRAMDAILRRSVQVVKASAYFCYLVGAVLIAFAIIANARYPQLRVAHLLAGVMGLTLLVSGACYHRTVGTGGPRKTSGRTRPPGPAWSGRVD